MVMTETVYTQAQMDGNVRALTRTLAELRERTDEVGRLAEAVRGMRETDALLRAQVDTLTAERDKARWVCTERADKIDAALALVRETVDSVFLSQDSDGEVVLYWRGTVADFLDRARALLDGAK
jgi:hypothetical protein